MADKILTFNGKTIGGPNGGGGMVVLKTPPFYGDGVTISGRTYPTVIIGNQEWLAENLDYKFDGLIFRDGTAGNILVYDEFDLLQAAYYDYDETTYGINGNKYGLLYSWLAVNHLNNHLSDLGIPTGWHVPSKSDFDMLFDTVGGQSIGNTVLKSTTGWKKSSYNGTDKYAFSGFPGGTYAFSNRSPYFGNEGYFAHFWTSTEDSEYTKYNAYCTYLRSSDDGSHSDTNMKCCGMSVRLVKDLT